MSRFEGATTCEDTLSPGKLPVADLAPRPALEQLDDRRLRLESLGSQ